MLQNPNPRLLAATVVCVANKIKYIVPMLKCNRKCNECQFLAKVIDESRSHVPGIQVLRENNFHPETMIRRGPEKAPAVSAGDISYLTLADMMTVEPVPKAQLCRWSSHRVMQWLNQIDLAEYAPNLRASGRLSLYI